MSLLGLVGAFRPGTAGVKPWTTTRGTGSAPHGPSHPDPEAGEITTLGWVLLLSQAGAEVAWQGVPAPEAQGDAYAGKSLAYCHPS